MTLRIELNYRYCAICGKELGIIETKDQYLHKDCSKNRTKIRDKDWKTKKKNHLNEYARKYRKRVKLKKEGKIIKIGDIDIIDS